MQRRAATISVAFFLVVSAGAYVTLTAADAPTVQVENPEYTLTKGEKFSPGDITYNVTELSDGSAKLAWTNESYRYTQAFEDGQEIQYRDGTYRVVIPNETDPTNVTLREVQSVDKPTVTQNGTEYVIVDRDGNKTLVPVDEYLPAPQTYTVEETDELVYENKTWTVDNITESTVPLYRIDSNVLTISLAEGGTETFADTTYVIHFDGGELVLSSDVDAYEQELENQRYFKERINGLWAVSVISALAAVLLIMLGFLPSRY